MKRRLPKGFTRDRVRKFFKKFGENVVGKTKDDYACPLWQFITQELNPEYARVGFYYLWIDGIEYDIRDTWVNDFIRAIDLRGTEVTGDEALETLNDVLKIRKKLGLP